MDLDTVCQPALIGYLAPSGTATEPHEGRFPLA
jgi:hypothetical protein